MTEEQYLDAISCPRHDPAKQGTEGLAGTGRSDAASEAEIDGLDEELNLDDTEDEEDQAEPSLPPGVILPDWQIYGRTEMVCRAICIKPERDQPASEALLERKMQGRAGYSFLFPGDRHYLYYKWRLAEHRAGRGYPPEEDTPTGMIALMKRHGQWTDEVVDMHA